MLLLSCDAGNSQGRSFRYCSQCFMKLMLPISAYNTVGKYANSDTENDLFMNQTAPNREFNSLTEQLGSSVLMKRMTDR